jgi:hypothetical protein
VEVWYTYFVEIRRYSLGLFYVLASSLLAPSGAYLEYANGGYLRHMLRKAVIVPLVVNRQP